jgi:TolA-binding protein
VDEMNSNLMTWLVMGALLAPEPGAGGGGAPAAGSGANTGTGASGEGGNTSQGPPETEIKLTQSKLDELIAGRVRKATQENERLAKEIEGLRPLQKKLEDLEHQLATSGKNDNEKKAIETEREIKRLQKALEEREAKLAESTKRGDAATERYTKYRVESAVQSALAGAKVLGPAMKDATALMVSETKGRIEEGPDGEDRLVFDVGGVTLYDAASAASQWLRTHQWFLAHPGGGSHENGTKGPKAGTFGAQLDSMSAEDLIRLGYGGNNG